MPEARDAARLARVRDRLRRENEELRRAAENHERRYYELFESAPDAYIVTNRAGHITEANRAAEVMIGLERRFLVGKPLAVYLGGYLGVSDALRSSLPIEEHELELRPRAGASIEVGVTASVVKDDSGSLEAVRWLIRDISRRKRAEEEVLVLNAELEKRVRDRTLELEDSDVVKDELLRELAQRTQVEREFVTNAAHELRTPVAAIASAVDVLQSGAKEHPPDRDRFLDHIEQQCARLRRLSHSLLVLARVQMSQEPPRLEDTDVAMLLAGIAADIAPAPGVDIVVECDGDVVARANRALLEQALQNVAENAAKYVERGRITISAAAHDHSVRIVVSDTGPGMSASERERAFERFRRGDESEHEGFGLGLAIAAQAIGALGGKIDIDSAAGQGTTVRIELPAAA